MTGNKILLIDDEQVVIDTVSDILETEGYQILSAKDGREGLEVYCREHPVLTILDLRMPVMNGIEFLDSIKLSPSAPSAVIVLTGHGESEDIKKCYSLGVSAFLRKPFNVYELKGIIRTSIDLKQTLCGLMEEITRRQRVEGELRRYRDHLEELVKERTEELDKTNLRLEAEIVERKKTEEALKRQLDEVERLNRLMVGRELRMEELKRRVNELEEQAERFRREAANAG